MGSPCVSWQVTIAREPHLCQSDEGGRDAAIDVEGPDHVAIQVADQSVSAAWYERLLNVRPVHEDVWGRTPTMLAAPDDSGIAVFQARAGTSPGVVHIAFRVTRQHYDAAKALLADEGIPFEEQDHEVCLSVYLHDPDGIQVELTTYH